MRYPGLILLCALALSSCNYDRYESCGSDRTFGSWGVTNFTHAFGQSDSLYYLVNPIGAVSDSIYFNGNYTDSYFLSDSTRVMLRFTTADSINFHIRRRYVVQANPTELIVEVDTLASSASPACTLLMKRDHDSDMLYRCGPDSLFKALLLREDTLYFNASGANGSGQNYVFFLPTVGFEKALNLADSLNRHPSLPKDKKSGKGEKVVIKNIKLP